MWLCTASDCVVFTYFGTNQRATVDVELCSRTAKKEVKVVFVSQLGEKPQFIMLMAVRLLSETRLSEDERQDLDAGESVL